MAAQVKTIRKKRSTPAMIAAALKTLENDFMADVKSGAYAVGEALPSYRELEEKYQVSYSICHAFYDLLKKRGQVICIPRKGVFLADTNSQEIERPNVVLSQKGLVVVGWLEIDNPEMKHNETSKRLQALENECARAQIPLTFCNLYDPTNPQIDKVVIAQKHIDLINTYDAAGVFFISSSNFRLDDEFNYRVAGLKVPLCALGECGGIPTILPDETASAYKATAHLLEQGHRKIAFLTFDTDLKWMRERLEGYREALGEVGLSSDESDIVRVPYAVDFVNQNAEFEKVIAAYLRNRYADLYSRYTAFLCASDEVGKVLLDYEQEHDVSDDKLPAFVCFDNNIRYLGYNMTSVGHTNELEAKTAFEMLFKKILHPGIRMRTIKVAGTLYVRESSRRTRFEKVS
jgi:DNA-binding LacI/PurR family transcriptional regulator